MTKRVRQHLPTLKKLQKRTISKGERKSLLVQGGKPLQTCLRECAVNILKGNVPMSADCFKKLKCHKQQLRELSHKKTSQKRRLQIEQKGGFLPLLLAPILGSLVGSLLPKK